MRIGILTHYDVNNMGAQLQLWAMYRHLETLGHEPVVLSYKKNYDFAPEMERRNQITLGSVPHIAKNYLLTKGLALTWHNVRKWQTLRNFRIENLRHDTYCTACIDAAVVGADEVFSLETGVNKMMFGHAVNTESMIAYAPSFGQTDEARIAKFHCRELMASGLRRFLSLSARDEQTQRLITSLTGRRAEIVCDPALLYPFPIKDYPLPSATPHKRYMVVYSYDSRLVGREEVEAIRSFARQHNLKIVSAGTYHKWCDVNIVCNPLEWLRCIAHAEAVITDTFHGTIAAAITARPMALSYSQKVNSRKMLDIISRLGLAQRMTHQINNKELTRIFSKEQNNEVINLRIKQMRESSKRYLNNALKLVV